MSTQDISLMIAIQFGSLIIALLSLIVTIIKIWFDMTKEK